MTDSHADALEHRKPVPTLAAMATPNPRPQPAERARLNALTISGWILAINVAVYLLSHYVYPSRVELVEVPISGAVNPGGAKLVSANTIVSPISKWLWFSFQSAIQQFEVWRFFTFQFVHANFWHIAGNMVSLMTLGPVVEEYLGRRRFLAFYLMCGASGPLGYLILSVLGAHYAPTSTLVGASAGVFGVLAAAAVVAPRDYVELIFPPTPVRLRTMAFIMLAVAAYTVFFHGQTPGMNAGGEAAHLAGAIMGLYLIKRPDLLDWAENWGPPRRAGRLGR